MAASIARSLAAEPEAAGSARDLVRRYAGAVTDAVLQDALLVITELVTNAVRYGGGEVAVRIHPGPRSLRLEVTDATHRIPQPRHAAPDAVEGRGLRIVEALASRWGVSIGDAPGKTVWAELDLTEPGTGPTRHRS